MTTFRGSTIQGQPAAKWKAIYAACAKHLEFIIEVKKYDEKRAISTLQMAWFHAVPVKIYAQETGYSKLEAERFLKMECGAEWFRRHYDDDRGQAGEVLFECQKLHCRKHFPRPLRIEGVYYCPNCRCTDFEPLFLLSKTELKVNEFSDFMENCANFLNSLGWRCPMPDPNWRINGSVGVRQ